MKKEKDQQRWTKNYLHGLYEAVKKIKNKKRIKRDGLKLLAWVIIGEGEKKGAVKTDGLKTVRLDNTVA